MGAYEGGAGAGEREGGGMVGASNGVGYARRLGPGEEVPCFGF